MNENDKYIIKEDYHGDIKLIKVDKPKVNLSKPTDNMNFKRYPSMINMQTINENNLTYTKRKTICLSKPQDIEISKKEQEINDIFNHSKQNDLQKSNFKYVCYTILKTLGVFILLFIMLTSLSIYPPISFIILAILINNNNNNKHL